MSRIGFALSMVLIVAVAAWAYHVNYRTAEALDRLAALEAEIAAERERLQVLGVEWAWLNRPERLARLARDNADALRLGPMRPEHFGEAASVPFPRREPEVGAVSPETRSANWGTQ